jgi:hypothetical protein
MVSSMEYTYRNTQNQQERINSQVIEGNFPYCENFKDLAVFKLNRFLISLLLTTVAISMVSYLAVVAKENSILQIHREINDYNYENIELQNKVDIVKSFYNIDRSVSKTNTLKKAEKVMEVSAVTPSVVSTKDIQNLNAKNALGY